MSSQKEPELFEVRENLELRHKEANEGESEHAYHAIDANTDQVVEETEQW